MDEMEHAEFDAAFAKLAEGYSEGAYEGRRFGLAVRRSGDGRRNSLFARIIFRASATVIAAHSSRSEGVGRVAALLFVIA